MDILSQHHFFDAEREDISMDGKILLPPDTVWRSPNDLGRMQKLGMYILLLHRDGRSLKLCA